MGDDWVRGDAGRTARKGPTQRELYEYLQRPEGSSTAEANAHFGMPSGILVHRLEHMSATERIRREIDGNRWRYWADPSVSWEQAEARAQLRARRGAEKAVERTNAVMRRGHGGSAAGQGRVEHRVIDGRRVRVTVCPTFVDDRFVADEAPRMFRSLQIGEYLPNDSSIARAYG